LSIIEQDMQKKYLASGGIRTTNNLAV